MQSLRDKLLKAGLVSEDQAKKVEEEKARPAPVAAPRAAPVSRTFHAPKPERSRPAIAVPKFAPLPGSKEGQRLEARKQVELDRKLRDLVMASEVPIDFGASIFYFVTRKAKLRRLTLTQAQATLLEEGKLAVVERPDPDRIEHALVPPEVAEQMLALSAKSVRFLNKAGAQVGFLTEDEIHSRAKEADEPESAEKKDEAFVTVKRAPLG